VTSEELIAALKIKGSFPTSNDLFSNADFLVLFNMKMKLEILPFMLKLNEEFFLQSKDFSIVPRGTYRIPTRAIGSKIRDLKMIDGNGNSTNIDRLYEEDRQTNASGYYMLRNSIELSSDFTSNTLRMKYFAQPGALVLSTECAQVSSIDTILNQVVVSSVPSSMITGSVIDFVQNNNPYDLLDYDVAIDSLSGTTMGFTSLPSGLEVGDWICFARQSPVPQVPDEVHPVLVQSALVSTLSSKKDKALDYESKVLMKNIEDVVNMLDPRVNNNSSKMRSGRLISHFTNRRY